MRGDIDLDPNLNPIANLRDSVYTSLNPFSHTQQMRLPYGQLDMCLYSIVAPQFTRIYGEKYSKVFPFSFFSVCLLNTEYIFDVSKNDKVKHIKLPLVLLLCKVNSGRNYWNKEYYLQAFEVHFASLSLTHISRS